MSYETLAEFKVQTGLKLDDAVMQSALDQAVKQMQSYILVPRVFSQLEKNFTQGIYPDIPRARCR